ncbi:NAD(P)H-hydrate dehydratase [Paracoccus methylarcula]|uniref:Bifunctional NAD(P)H-hydrate repair enzyme n=1 Tax=Paracoccus methylarcula TaxID=72022 RepID=A0A422R1Y2_9RHOB|nr:NAD(P)H-hydrate dehydratase [Paracoccus methylarcula]RNF36224.1 NAD(P)H-hydrate dehydratase [Paracoccus methylarcula]
MLFGTEILTTAQMRAIESAAMVSGKVSGLTLMERAGAAVAGEIRLRWPKPGRATVLCGPGNNGGDGYVIARLLAQAGWQLHVLGLDNAPGPDAAEMKRRWRRIGPIAPLTEAGLRQSPASDICIDAIFGTGLTRPPEGQIAAVLRQLGRMTGDGEGYPCLVAVDCPSGLCMDSGEWLHPDHGEDTAPVPLHAGLTVAFDSPKPGHLLQWGPTACGKLMIADIGLRHWRERRADTRADAMCPPALRAIWPEFPVRDSRMVDVGSCARIALGKGISAGHPAGHKYSHGHALVVAGPAGHGGAARLAARAALRGGAGLVTLCPPAAAMAEHAGPPDALMRRGLDNATQMRAMLTDPRITALCLGPGCGVNRAAGLLPVVLDHAGPCVLDADALTALAQAPHWPGGLSDNCVLTPHAGEFARLFPDLDARLAETPMRGPAFSRTDALREAASRCGAVVLLKGPDTVIAAPDGQACIHSASDVPWLATAGTGDVLAGLITGFLARGIAAFEAAALAVLLHARAARRFGPGLIADDLPEQLPFLFRELGLDEWGRK